MLRGSVAASCRSSSTTPAWSSGSPAATTAAASARPPRPARPCRRSARSGRRAAPSARGRRLAGWCAGTPRRAPPPGPPPAASRRPAPRGGRRPRASLATPSTAGRSSASPRPRFRDGAMRDKGGQETPRSSACTQAHAKVGGLRAPRCGMARKRAAVPMPRAANSSAVRPPMPHTPCTGSRSDQRPRSPSSRSSHTPRISASVQAHERPVGRPCASTRASSCLLRTDSG